MRIHIGHQIADILHSHQTEPGSIKSGRCCTTQQSSVSSHETATTPALPGHQENKELAAGKGGGS